MPEPAPRHPTRDLGRTAADVLARFLFDATPQVSSVRELSGGSVHQTWTADTSAGRLVLQRSNHPFLAAATAQAVTINQALQSAGWQVQLYLPARQGGFVSRMHDGLWRVCNYVPGLSASDVPAPVSIESIGALLAGFHTALDGTGQKPVGLVPRLHDTQHCIAQLGRLRSAFSTDPLLKEISTVTIERFDELVRRAPRERPQAIHGDSRLGNVLFDPEGNAVTLIDPDSYMTADRALDLGDAVNSLLTTAISSPGFTTTPEEVLSRFVRGYAMNAKEGSVEEIHARTVRGTQRITIELTARFLIDFVEDRYFGWDSDRFTSRRAHNRHRAVTQAQVYESVFGGSGIH